MSTLRPKRLKFEKWGRWKSVMHLIAPADQGFTMDAWLNDVYSVRVQQWYTRQMNIRGTETGLRMSICRRDGKPIRGSHWKDLQRIKDELGFSAYWACEWYPPKDAVLDPANVYYLTLWPQENDIPAHCGLKGVAGINHPGNT